VPLAIEKPEFRPAVPLFVKESKSALTVPRLLTVLVLVVPPNTRANVPVELTAVLQFEVVPQLVLVAPDHELKVPA
jgi:hypothetical protein